MKETMPFVLDILLGAVLLIAGLFMQVDYYNSMVFSAGVGLVMAGGVHLARLIYWQRPERQEEYKARQKQAHIDAVDERKQFLRMKSGQMAYQIMLVVLFLLAFVLALLRVEAWIILMVFLLTVFQWGLGVVLFRMLEKRM